MHILPHDVMCIAIGSRPVAFNRLSVCSLVVEVRERLGFFGGLLDALLPVDRPPIESRRRPRLQPRQRQGQIYFQRLGQSRRRRLRRRGIRIVADVAPGRERLGSNKNLAPQKRARRDDRGLRLEFAC